MTTIPKVFSDGKRFLLRFSAPARVQTSDGEKTCKVSGEAIVFAHGDHPTSRGLSLERFGLACSSVDAKKGPTGVITVVGKSTGGALRIEGEETQLRIEITCEVNYESLDRALVPDMYKGHYYIPAKEPAAGHISGRLLEKGTSLVLSECRVEVVCAAGGFEEVQLIVIKLEDTPLLPLPDRGVQYRGMQDRGSGSSAESNIDSNICIQVNRRRIVIQPVGFRASATDTTPSGSTGTAQLNEAQHVWEKACINIQINSIVLITDATLKTSSDLAAIRASYTHPDPNVIEVFFVANSLSSTGGGNAGAIGVASCKVVIAEPNSGNPVLTAHELGHVLGLLHPNGTSNSDAGTVMAPTGSAMNPGTEFATHFMCININNPVLETLPDLCCLTHDIGNHYIRDFPVDAGAEPSDPLPAGMTRYSMSNVWNRLTNTAGGYSVTTGPDHEQPVRYNADMTPKTNYLFAKVEQIVNLKVRNAVVKFYRKNPGSGGGASNLLLLGQVPVPDALSVGVPQTVSLPWQVPAGTPQHSCVFAVVRSDAEPEGDPNVLDWSEFEDLSHNDNDWAQRNLDIQNFSPGNIEEGNNVESAPCIIRIPSQGLPREVRLELAVDAHRAEGLASLAVEILGKEQFELKPGEQAKFTSKAPIVPGQDLPIAIHGTIPGGMPPGRSFTINVNPSVGGRNMAGFACELRVGKPSATIAQVLDAASAAYMDLSKFAELPFAHNMVKELRVLLKDPPYTTDEMAKALARFEGIIRAGQSELKGLAAVEKFAAIDAMIKWEKILAEFGKGKVSSLAVIEAFRKISNRLLTAAFLLAESSARVAEAKTGATD